MKYIKDLLTCVLVSFLLAGCSYFDTAPPVVSQGTVGAQGGAVKLPLPADGDVAGAVARSTKGAVQIFSLDPAADFSGHGDSLPSKGGAIEVSPLRAVPPHGHLDSSVSPAMGNASVQIFSLEGGAAMGSATEFTPLSDKPAMDSGKAVIFFDHDSTKLGTKDLALLDSVAQSAAKEIRVEGYASVRAGEQTEEKSRRIVNLKVSTARAFAVARALIQRGVPAEAIRLSAWGDVGQTGQAEESRARRVEIFY